MMPARRLVAAAIIPLLGCFTVAPARADEPPAGSIVTTVQPPAWLVHGDTETPLKPGMAVQDGDRLRTAAGGRAYLALPELSTVKIGENTEFATQAMDMTSDTQGHVFKGVLHILKGVFRFTTSLEGKILHRDVQIQVVTATIGIRGTDVWGRAGADGGLVALLEGKISMDMPGHADMKMDEPMHYMTMANSGQMEMNRTVTSANVADWAAQTDVKPGAGVLSSSGHWIIAVLSSPDAGDAQQLMTQLAADGYPAEDSTVNHKGHPWHRLVIRQCASYKDAKTLADRLKSLKLKIEPWIYQAPAGTGTS